MNKRNRLNLRVLVLISTLLGGFTARADLIQLNGTITSGHATNTFGDFNAFVHGQNFYVSGEGPIGYLGNITSCSAYSGDCRAPGSYYMSEEVLGPIPDGFDPASGGGALITKDGIGLSCDVPSGFYNSFDGPTCGFDISINYTLNIPDPGPSPPQEMVLTAPLRVYAEFYDPYPVADGNEFYLRASGVGKATVTLDNVYENHYVLQSAQYDFFAVPEPATMTLAGLGLLAVILLRRRAQRLYPDCR